MKEKIEKIVAVISENYPDFARVISEMPISKTENLTEEILQKNYDNLVQLFRDYVAENQLEYTSQKGNLGHL